LQPVLLATSQIIGIARGRIRAWRWIVEAEQVTTTSIGTLLAVVTCGLIGVTFTLLVVTLGGLALTENEYEDCWD
jgi:hypothetical protein